MFNVSGKIKK